MRSVVDGEHDMHIAGETSDGHRVVELAWALEPDVIVMDTCLPGLDGVDACRDIRGDSTLAATRILMLTAHEADENVIRSTRAGASGFIGKNADEEVVTAAIRAVHRGEAMLSPRATRALMTASSDPRTTTARPCRRSHRESARSSRTPCTVRPTPTSPTGC